MKQAMIRVEAVNLFRSYGQSLVQSGLIEKDDFQNVIGRLRTDSNAKAESELWTRSFVAKKLKVSVRTVDRLARDEQLRAIHVGKRSIRFSKDEVERLMEGGVGK